MILVTSYLIMICSCLTRLGTLQTYTLPFAEVLCCLNLQVYLLCSFSKYKPCCRALIAPGATCSHLSSIFSQLHVQLQGIFGMRLRGALLVCCYCCCEPCGCDLP